LGEEASVIWNNVTLADFNKLENMQKKYANLCDNRFIQPNSFCNYESVLNSLHFKKLYSRRQNHDVLLLINIFKNKTDCYFITDTLGLHAAPEQIREVSTLKSAISKDLALL
jgi:hypothetical protein